MIEYHITLLCSQINLAFLHHSRFFMARLIALPLILILLSLSHGSSDARKIPCPEKGNVLLPLNLVLNVLPRGPAPPSSPSGGGNPIPILAGTGTILGSHPSHGEGN
jgi:hypothetical protein